MMSGRKKDDLDLMDLDRAACRRAAAQGHPMTARPMTEGERDALPNFAQIYSELEIARENLNRRYLNNNDQSAGRSSRAVFSAMCLLDTARAELLSTSAAVRGMREALEAALPMIADHAAGGRRYTKPTDASRVFAMMRAALSGIEPGEDEQARGQGRSAPISTDTKGTTK